MEDFNIDDYLNDPDFEQKMADYKERMIHEAIEHNYENMAKNGISDWHVRHMNKDEMTQLKETLQFMMKHFLEYEEYEKVNEEKDSEVLQDDKCNGDDD